ncbi:hypothetical protein EZ428_16370 [Pedobacter frigiditerrae]|uniref:Nucleotidyl transferase AbiEii toxin, Type IV TA system n=1 Tax=Pedobacter frigiditerrae TaxID=2530452 RepID=A0A4R0MQU3_9SPHI|nr:nucleotidyl transferase AbiEii/AbiGii toxin family protein [Pedobacter frigiditerrae]TCC89271.1 hypothetical protein EZ428_16370 [Pedobacter frigiditerrae]
MAAVSPELFETIVELQNLPSLNDAILAGGTNLAIRYDHRESVDIDLFFSDIVGKAHYQKITEEIKQYFDERATHIHFPCDESDQFIFLRFWIKTRDLNIKVEIMQNANFLDKPEIVNSAKLASKRDIGILKLMTAANRGSFKDIYDLDYLTEDILLSQLMLDLKYKQETYNGNEYRTIFDLDGEVSPVKDPLRLLLFEEKSAKRRDRPNHSDYRILPQANSKNLLTAKSSYRTKVRKLCDELGIEFPGIMPLN